ncbi:MAG TPA: alpha/beta fold hydrolase [Thermoanaerobaculia bacterium]|nr:alpha/beta fold hydrolase [Thermoanaerobaculia bacterium]
MNDPTRASSRVPPRPSALEEKLASALFFVMSPHMAWMEQPGPPNGLEPFEPVAIERTVGAGVLTATWYPASGEMRGVVLLLHPWLAWGKSYFYRRGRIQALRAAGYAALAVDLPGFGGSGPRAGLMDRDVEDAVEHARRRAAGKPVHLWGVSSGGYWAHPVLSRVAGISGAMFEDVSSHLITWSWRRLPLKRPLYVFFLVFFRRAFRYLDLRSHAPALRVNAAAYVGGERDLGVLPEETRELARLARGTSLIVPGADHLAAIKVDNEGVIGLALETFRKAEALTPPTPSLLASPPPAGREGA